MDGNAPTPAIVGICRVCEGPIFATEARRSFAGLGPQHWEHPAPTPIEIKAAREALRRSEAME